MSATISNAILTVSPKGGCTIAYLPITVTDGDNSTMTREVAVYLTP